VRLLHGIAVGVDAHGYEGDLLGIVAEHLVRVAQVAGHHGADVRAASVEEGEDGDTASEASQVHGVSELVDEAEQRRRLWVLEDGAFGRPRLRAGGQERGEGQCG
jgi:hypothetical protein